MAQRARTLPMPRRRLHFVVVVVGAVALIAAAEAATAHKHTSLFGVDYELNL